MGAGAHSLEGAAPRLSTALPPHSKLPSGPSKEEAVICPDFPASLGRPPGEAPGRSHISVPVQQGAQLLATWALIPRALNVPSRHWAFHPPIPQSRAVCPLETVRWHQQNPCISNFSAEPYLVTLTQWWGSILKICNVRLQIDWVLLLPEWWDLLQWT